MALSEISKAKQGALKKDILEMTKAGKNLRQMKRMALKKYNVKLTLPKK